MSRVPSSSRKRKSESHATAADPAKLPTRSTAPEPELEPPETMKPIRIGSRLLRGAAR